MGGVEDGGEWWTYDESNMRGNEGLVGWCRGENGGIREEGKVGGGRTQCTRLPLYAGSGRGECRLTLPPFMERLLPSLEPETYRSWAKALAIAPSATSMRLILTPILGTTMR
ncbi:hypothetical protein DVH24_011687 [Malus domestica]|uniref:Uncharacterized protein n=1 Tax=Malus domestica TaxID=3750 RepID=A0A498K0V4_MALDO|nr:hypothetical protein DVH24_011687 [Malus domestica]